MLSPAPVKGSIAPSRSNSPPQAHKQNSGEKFVAKSVFPRPVTWPIAGRSAGTAKPAIPCKHRSLSPRVAWRGFGSQKPNLRGRSTEVQEKAF
eukprot:4549534-Amphidinium_carterae.1